MDFLDIWDFKIVEEYVFTKNIAEEQNIPLICCIFISVWISVVKAPLSPVLATPKTF